MVLCGASAYSKKYYFNPEMDLLPVPVQEELRALCVSFVETVGGVLTIEFDAGGSLQIKTDAEEEDILYDEIDSAVSVQRLCRENRELFEQLEMFYQVFLEGT